MPHDPDSGEQVTWTVITAILAYQFAMLTYYGWMDFVIWSLNVKHIFKLSVPKIYLGNIKEGDIDTLTEQGKTFIFHDVKKDDYGVYWVGRSPEPKSSSSYGAHSLLNNERTSMRRRLNAFMFLELGTPFLWGLGSLIVATYRIWN